MRGAGVGIPLVSARGPLHRARQADRSVSAQLLLAHGDDGFRIELELRAFAETVGAVDRVDLTPQASPDEAVLDRARLEAASVGLFGPHLAVLRRPLRAAGRSNTATDKLLALVAGLPDGAALALAEERPSRDLAKPPALLKRLADAVRERGGIVVEHNAPRRDELRGWISNRATTIGIAIEPPAANLLAERIGGAIWETDIERGEQTRVADSELRKLGTYTEGRAITVTDVDALVADTRPASVFAVTNALDQRDGRKASEALRRALAEGQPVLRIMASVSGRISDLLVARDLAARKTPANEITKRVGRGNARVAERLVEAARRYSEDELKGMLRGLFEADLVIKRNDVDPESALVAWLGEFVLAARR